MFVVFREKHLHVICMKNAKNRPAHTGKKKGGPFSGDWHVAHTSMGMGDYYGTGIRQPLAKMRDGMGMNELSKKKLGTPPKTIV